MGNCIVSKFNGSTNKNLPVFGHMEALYVQNYTNINRNKKFKASVKTGDGYFTVNSGSAQQTVDISSGQVNFVKSKLGVVPIDIDIVNTKGLTAVIDFDKMAGSSSLNELCAVQGFIDGGSEMYRSRGSINKIGMMYPNLAYFEMTYLQTVTGRIENFAGCLSITTIKLNSSKGIVGDLKDFADAQVANGRTSGSVAITCSNALTYNGAAIADNTVKTITYSASGYTVS